MRSKFQYCCFDDLEANKTKQKTGSLFKRDKNYLITLIFASKRMPIKFFTAFGGNDLVVFKGDKVALNNFVKCRINEQSGCI